MAHDADHSPAPGERIERTEVVEHTSTEGTHATRRAAPMWVWLLPLVVAAVVLAWYIFTRGEPNAPNIGDLDVPAPEIISVDEEPDPIVVVPEIETADPPVGGEAPGATQPPASSVEQDPAPSAEQPSAPSGAQ